MQAIILAGGFGTRLRPLTYTRPKSLLPILNKPMIMHLVETLPPEVDRIVLAANYRRRQLEDYFEENGLSGRVVVNEEPMPLGTGGAVKFAKNYIDDTFFVLNSDILTSLDLKRMLSFHKEKRGAATISLWPVENVSEFGVVEYRDDGAISRFVEKPRPEDAPSNLINAGAYILEPEVLDYIEKGRMVSMEKEVFPRLIADGRGFCGYRIDEENTKKPYWIDLGRPKSCINATRLLLDRMNTTGFMAKNAKIDGEFLHSTAGAKVVVKAGSRIEDSILYDNAVIGEDAEVECCIIGEGASVGDGAVLRNVVVGDKETVKAGETLHDRIVWEKPVPADYPNKQVGNAIEF
ncbi:MAG: hypothetical protein CVT48_01850 [Thermoplasmata archaeon HGW-Thermoplasmata-1]|nr:MAG: hypothetical protein CVT48_01850 [Thermoplasmata archaeon HGW-Thermoplasmata-1]